MYYFECLCVHPFVIGAELVAKLCVRLFATSWTVTYQAPIAHGISQEQGSTRWISFPYPGSFLAGIQPALAGGFFPLIPGSPYVHPLINWLTCGHVQDLNSGPLRFTFLFMVEKSLGLVDFIIVKKSDFL